MCVCVCVHYSAVRVFIWNFFLYNYILNIKTIWMYFFFLLTVVHMYFNCILLDIQNFCIFPWCFQKIISMTMFEKLTRVGSWCQHIKIQNLIICPVIKILCDFFFSHKRIMRYITNKLKMNWFKTRSMAGTSQRHDERSVSLKAEREFWNTVSTSRNTMCHHVLIHLSASRWSLGLELTLRRLMSYIYIYIYIYGAPILDVSRSHTTTQHSR